MREREVKLLHLLRKGDLENCPLLSKPTLQYFCHNWIDKFPACGFVCRDLKAWQSVTGAPSLIWFREASSACQRETNESWQFHFIIDLMGCLPGLLRRRWRLNISGYWYNQPSPSESQRLYIPARIWVTAHLHLQQSYTPNQLNNLKNNC